MENTKLPINLNTIFENLGITDLKIQYLLTLNELEKTQKELEYSNACWADCIELLKFIKRHMQNISQMDQAIRDFHEEVMKLKVDQ